MYEEFKQDHWGLVDPDSFESPLSYTDTDKGDENELGLKEVFERVVNRINKLKGK